MKAPTFPRLFRQPCLLAACACLHAAFTLGFALSRLYSFKASLLDIGVFNQLMWNTVHHGSLVTTATVPFMKQHWLGFHFSPLLVLITPFYAFWGHMELLQAVQSLCIGFAGIVLFYALRSAGARAAEAWAGCLLFWLNPFVLGAALWDFHEIAFSILLLPAALWALMEKRLALMLTALALLVLTKEQYGISAAGFGVLWGWRYGQWRRALGIIAAGLGVFAAVFFLLMPAFSTHGVHPMFTDASTYNRYGWLGGPWHDKAATFAHILLDSGSQNISGLFYLALLLCSGLFLSLAAPVYLAAGGGDFVANLLSCDPFPRHLAAYHSAALIPVILVASYEGYAWIRRKLPDRAPWIYCALGILLLFSPCRLAFYPFSYWELSAVRGLSQPDRSAIAFIRAQYPVQALSAQCNVAMFFSARNIITPFPYGAQESDAVILRLDDPYLHHDSNHFGLPFYGSAVHFAQSLRSFLREPGWHIAYWQAPWLVMARGPGMRDETGVRRDIAQRIDALAAGEP